MMRILYLAHRIPYPPDKGDKIRGWHFLKRLAARHELDLACLVDDPEDLTEERMAPLRAVCRRFEAVYRPRPRALAAAMLALGGRRPMSVPFFGDRRLARTVQDWMRRTRYDAVLAHSAPMTQYVPARKGLVRIADLCDVDSEKWQQYSETSRFPRRWVYAREARTLRAWETDIAKTWNAVVLATAPEAAIFRRFCSVGRVEVVPNGVDAEFFAPVREPGATVLFMGAMDYHPNVEGVVWFAKSIWPLIRAEKPDARFVVVGPRPADPVRALHDPSTGIEIRGRIPDVRDALREAAVVVAPLRIARGIQNKVLEGMASARAVVCTHAAFEGLTAIEGRDALVADDPVAFAGHVLALLRDPVLRLRMGERARAAVVAAHSWDANATLLERLLAGVTPADRPLPRPHVEGLGAEAGT